MQRSGQSLAPTFDRATYLVLDQSEDGHIFCETYEAEANRETVIQDIVSGKYKKPVCVIAFNAAECWARDVTHDLARRMVDSNEPLSEPARNFVERVSDLLGPGLQPKLTNSLNRTVTPAPLFKWF